MRKLKNFSAISLSLSLILCIGVLTFMIVANASDGKTWYELDGVTDAYTFPEYEGEEALTYDEIIEFNQIPQDILKNISTEGLIESCLNYPLYADGMIFSNKSVYHGFIETCERFNGLQELFKREDAGEKLLHVFENLDIDNLARSSDSDPLRVRFLSYLIAEEKILDTFESEERDELVDICIENIAKTIVKYPEIYSIEATTLITARILNEDSDVFFEYVDENENVQEFIENGIMVSFTSDDIIDLVDACIDSLETNY